MILVAHRQIGTGYYHCPESLVKEVQGKIDKYNFGTRLSIIDIADLLSTNERNYLSNIAQINRERVSHFPYIMFVFSKEMVLYS